MRVLLVNDYATPTAGAELMTAALSEGLRRRGHEVRVLASRAELIPGPSFADYACFGTTTRWQVVSSAFNPSARRALGRALEEFRPGVVHVKMFLWQLSPAILPALRDVPCLYQAVTYKPICPRGTKLLPDRSPCTVPSGPACYRNGCLTARSWLPMMLQKRLWHRWRRVFGMIVAPSEAVRRRLLAEGLGPVEVVPNGCPPRAPRPPLSGPPLVGYAGRLAPEKGVDTLLRAFAVTARSMPELRLWVAGHGPDRAALEGLATELGIAGQVDFLGAVERAALERRFERLWVQVVPSVWEEPFGLVAIESMMRGTALVASRVGGLEEIAGDGDVGMLTPAGEVEPLAAALATLARDRARCERLGAAGRRVALARFGLDGYVERLEAIYRRLVERGPRG